MAIFSGQNHKTDQTDGANEVECRIVAALEREGIHALNPPAEFPMEAAQRMA